jgi:hypothetical protein
MVAGGTYFVYRILKSRTYKLVGSQGVADTDLEEQLQVLKLELQKLKLERMK